MKVEKVNFARILVTAGLALSALCTASVASAENYTVEINQMRYGSLPANLKAGDTIVWVNKDLVAHTATAAGLFDSHEIRPDASWTYVANTPGRHAYICTFHPTMKATLTVKRKP